jgi:hypothetical protein
VWCWLLFQIQGLVPPAVSYFFCLNYPPKKTGTGVNPMSGCSGNEKKYLGSMNFRGLERKQCRAFKTGVVGVVVG